MAEPTTSGGALAFATTTMAGTTAILVLGIDSTTIMWALAGGFFGASFAPRTGPLQAIVKYGMASLLSALFATAASKYLSVVEPLYTWAFAGLISFGFYPITKTLVGQIPSLVIEGLRRFLGLGPPPPPGGGTSKDGQS